MTLLRLIARNHLAVLGAAMLAVILLLALLTPLLPLADPNITATADRFQRPFSPGHLLGTDHLGRDLLSRLLWGTGLSLAVGAAAAIIAALIGSLIGLIAAYSGGNGDNLLMRMVDMLMAFPYILLALAIVAALGPGLMNALIAVAIVNIPFFARNIRGATVSLVQREFVDAARLAGMSHSRIIFSELLPNVLPVIVVAVSTTIGWMILETAGLSFLGLGSQPPQADLGSMLGEARSALITSPHTSAVPGLMIFLIVVSINLLGDGIRDALDPRLSAGALERPSARTRIARQRHSTAPGPKHGAAATALPDILATDNLCTEFHVGDRVYKSATEVSITLGKGECLGIIGESGSGKSVTALAIASLVASPPGVITGGAVWFAGEDLLSAPYQTLRRIRGNRIAYVFQDPLSTLHPLLPVGEQIAEAITTHHPGSRQQTRQRVLELLESVRIPNPEKRINSLPHTLSGGMRQRISIAMALANEPDIIIADEPTTALDVTVQAEILSLFDALRREHGLAMIFITHDFAVVNQLCDRVAVMYAGKIVECGETAEILSAPAHPYTRQLIACLPTPGQGRRRLNSIPGVPPTLDKLPAGCAFAARCDKATSLCRTSEVALERMARREVRCLLPETPDRAAMQ